MSEREYSVVVFGASGFTGRRVASYLGSRAADVGIRWAPAGRDPSKITRALQKEGMAEPPAPIAADSNSPESLRDMAARTDVVLNLVGPYSLGAEPLIEACIEAGTHYLDLTGEIPFVRQMLERYGARAREAGVKVIPMSGFEALPPDFLVGLACRQAAENGFDELSVVDVIASFRPPPGGMRGSDGISGGTAQSMAVVLGGEDPGSISDPAALIEDPNRASEVRSLGSIALRPRRDGDQVIVPMQPAAFINPAVIQRAAAIRAGEDGFGERPFRYREGIAIGGSSKTLAPRMAMAGALAAAQAGFAQFAKAPRAVRAPVADVMSKFFPDSGYGPDPERMKGWSWSMKAIARSGAQVVASAELEAEGHPGYLSTARMVGEAGIMLSSDADLPQSSGFLTPATALGLDAAYKFGPAGMRFTVN